MPGPDQEFWEEFLNMYKMYPCLWNSKSQEYSNRQLREVALADLVEKCKEKYTNADRNFVAKKIHSFRCAFRRELKKVVTSMKNGTSAEDIYIPTLWYYDLLSFIADAEIPRDDQSNIGNNSYTQNEESDGETLSDPQDIVETILESPASPLPGSSGSSAPDCGKKRPRITQSSKYGRKNGNQKELLMLAKNAMKKFCSATSDSGNPAVKCLSDFEIAGLKFGRDLASLEPDQRLFVEKIVADAMFYGKQNKLTENSSLQLGVHQPENYQRGHRSMYHSPHMQQHHSNQMEDSQRTPGLSQFSHFK